MQGGRRGRCGRHGSGGTHEGDRQVPVSPRRFPGLTCLLARVLAQRRSRQTGLRGKSGLGAAPLLFQRCDISRRIDVRRPASQVTELEGSEGLAAVVRSSLQASPIPAAADRKSYVDFDVAPGLQPDPTPEPCRWIRIFVVTGPSGTCYLQTGRSPLPIPAELVSLTRLPAARFPCQVEDASRLPLTSQPRLFCFLSW